VHCIASTEIIPLVPPAYAIFAPQNLGRLEADFKEEQENASKDGFTEDELKAAKSGWLQGRQVSRGRDSRVAGTRPIAYSTTGHSTGIRRSRCLTLRTKAQ